MSLDAASRGNHLLGLSARGPRALDEQATRRFCSHSLQFFHLRDQCRFGNTPDIGPVAGRDVRARRVHTCNIAFVAKPPARIAESGEHLYDRLEPLARPVWLPEAPESSVLECYDFQCAGTQSALCAAHHGVVLALCIDEAHVDLSQAISPE